MIKIIKDNEILVLVYNKLLIINLKSGRSCEECVLFDSIKLGMPCDLSSLIKMNNKIYHKECSIVNLLSGSITKVAESISRYKLSLFLIKYIKHENEVNIS